MAERPVRRRCCGNLLAHIGPPDEGHKSTEEISTARGNSFDRLSADCATLVVGHQRLEGCFPYYLPFGRSSDKTMSAARSAPCRNIKLSQYRDIPIDGWVEWARGAQLDGWSNHEHSDFLLPLGCHWSICVPTRRDDGGAARDGATLEAAGCRNVRATQGMVLAGDNRWEAALRLPTAIQKDSASLV
jgi:hypothetical protein